MIAAVPAAVQAGQEAAAAVPPAEQSVPPAEQSVPPAAESEQMSIEQLNTELNDSIQKLKNNLQSKLKDLTFENNSIQNICAKISELNLLGDFDRSFYSSLNNYFKKNGNPSNYLMDGEVLNQVIYSQIINGKYGTDWPSESQKKLIQESLGLSVGESISSAFGFNKGGRKIIKNKRKYIRRKNIKK